MRKDYERLMALSKNISSDELFTTSVPYNRLPRNYWIANSQELLPPWIGSSGFVPPAMVEFLMRCKKKTALGVKWKAGDEITNMEGAMHTFVTSVELAWLHGERGYDKGHTFTPYPHDGKFRRGRQVLVSNMIHQDFETEEVMLEVSKLTATETTIMGDFEFLAHKEKQSDDIRNRYDDLLRRLMVFNLTVSGKLPSFEEGMDVAMSRTEAKDFLANEVLDTSCDNVLSKVKDKLFWLFDNDPGTQVYQPILSLEILVATAFQQFRNEMDTLERICPQGYIYTFSAPKIFIREFGDEDGLMACIYAAGLKHYLHSTKLQNMRAFQLPEVPGEWTWAFKNAFSDVPDVQVMDKSELYGNKDDLDSYSPPFAGTMLVLHNCSDGFGQNIQYEQGNGSLDAIIGRFTSAAGSLLNSREDLVSRVAIYED